MSTIYSKNDNKRVDSSREFQIFDIDKYEDERMSTYNEVLEIFRKAFLCIDNTFLSKKNLI